MNGVAPSLDKRRSAREREGREKRRVDGALVVAAEAFIGANANLSSDSGRPREQRRARARTRSLV